MTPIPNIGNGVSEQIILKHPGSTMRPVTLDPKLRFMVFGCAQLVRPRHPRFLFTTGFLAGVCLPIVEP